jgi:hypothetical protein
MTPLEEQFALLKTVAEQAALSMLPSGAAIVSVPRFVLPAGWSRPDTTVRFFAPVGYPFAKPDCFWVDPDLRLSSGAMPQNTQIQPIPETSEPLLWFSWHTTQWHPSRDTLVSYFYVIMSRLREAK